MMRLNVFSACLAVAFANLARGESFPVQISVDASKLVGEMKPIHRFFGADEPNYAYMKDGRKLLGELGELGGGMAGGVYFRTHNLLCSGDGTPALKWGSTNIYTEDADGKPVYDFTTVDRIFDAYRKAGVRPYAQLGFMPEALSIHPVPYQHEWRPGLKYDTIETGWAYPPKDWGKWEELCFRWAAHCVERYGMGECEQWYWEVWNEANGAYWKGTHEEFFRLHDVAVHGVRRAIPKARVGGGDWAGTGGKFAEEFLEHCLHGKSYAPWGGGEEHTPMDFVSFHAKGSPEFVDESGKSVSVESGGVGHVRMGISAQLKTLDSGFRMIAKHPELKATPIIIGESDPDGCAACQGKALGYRNGLLYASYTAASFARKPLLAEKAGVNLEGALTWAFEFEDQPYFAGQRVMANNGIDLPVLNVFRMMSKMSGLRVSATSSGQVGLEEITARGVRGKDADVGVMASKNVDGSVSVLVWHYHEDDLPGEEAEVTVSVGGLATGAVTETRWAVDETHSNAYAAWKRMKSPNPPTDRQYGEMVRAGRLERAGEPGQVTVVDGAVKVQFTLVRQGVSLVVVEPVR